MQRAELAIPWLDLTAPTAKLRLNCLGIDGNGPTVTRDDFIEALGLAARRTHPPAIGTSRAYRALFSYKTVESAFKEKATAATMPSTLAKSLGACSQEVPICISDAVLQVATIVPPKAL